jgi:threonine dehydratase
MSASVPSFRDILAARRAVYAQLQPTPLLAHPGLSELLGASVWVKHENHLPTGSFKVRGGVHLASTLSAAERKAGLYTASTGNHGQSIAFAGKVSGARARIAVPEGANPDKVSAMRGLGAEVVFHGPDFDTAREWIQKQAAEEGARFVAPTDPELIAGVGTYALEILEALPDVDVVFVPVGAGSGAVGVCLVAKTVNPAIEVIGVQASAAPAMQLAWSGADASRAVMQTRAEGVATRVPFENTQRIMRDPKRGLDDFVLVSDEAMEDAIRSLLEHTHNLAEHAGAAALAAAVERAPQLAGKKVVLVQSGGNLQRADLARILA